MYSALGSKPVPIPDLLNHLGTAVNWRRNKTKRWVLQIKKFMVIEWTQIYVGQKVINVLFTCILSVLDILFLFI